MHAATAVHSNFQLKFRFAQIAVRMEPSAGTREVVSLSSPTEFLKVIFKHDLEYLLPNLIRQESKGTKSGPRFLVILSSLIEPAPAFFRPLQSSSSERTEV